MRSKCHFKRSAQNSFDLPHTTQHTVHRIFEAVDESVRERERESTYSRGAPRLQYYNYKYFGVFMVSTANVKSIIKSTLRINGSHTERLAFFLPLTYIYCVNQNNINKY